MGQIIAIVANMGSGKTLSATLLAVEYSQLFPQNTIYANYHLSLPNAKFNQFMVFPFSKLSNCMIIADDFYALRNVDGFISIMVNASRKKEITIVLTAQDYTMIPKRIRVLCSSVFSCYYNKLTDKVFMCNLKTGEILVHSNAVEKSKLIYDTTEIVEFPLEQDIIDAITQFSQTERDIEVNCELYFTNYRKRMRIKKQIQKVKFGDS